MSANAWSLSPAISRADFHRVMSDTLRVDILTSLNEAGELEPEVLADALYQDVSVIRESLQSLRQAGFVFERRERFQAIYRLADDLPAWFVIALGTARSA